MKAAKKSTTNKLIARFDSQLKVILMSDLLAKKNMNAVHANQAA